MPGLTVVDIKSDMPTCEVANKRARSAINNAKMLGYSAIKIIHGYGSHGKGGKIRISLRSLLAELESANKISAFIPGESFSIFDEATRNAFIKCPELRRDSDLEASNNGISIIIL